MVDAVDRGKYFREKRFMTRAVAIVGADRGDDCFLVFAHETLQRLQVGPALGKAGYGMREIGLALQFQRTLEFGACCRLLKRFGTHGMALAAIVKRRAV